MMRQLFRFPLIVLLTLLALPLLAQEEETLVVIDTDMGKIKVKLYNETPLHKENFIKHVKEKTYEGLLFHRVIKQFMIQGGDITSKDAPLDSILGNGDPGYRIPAEIIYPKYFHKRGALCAARTSDDQNPEKESSGTQFYIVTGKFYTEFELNKMEREQNITFTEEEREAYMLRGGAPNLDGKYTVFGEVVTGQKVVDKIQLVMTDSNDRPLENIAIKTMYLVDQKGKRIK